MSGTAFVTEKELEELARCAPPIPSQFQLGEKVWYWQFPEGQPAYYTPAVVFSVTFSSHVSYALAFKVGNSRDFVIQGGLRGFISRPGKSMEENGGLVDISVLREDLIAQERLAALARPQLHLVPTAAPSGERSE